MLLRKLRVGIIFRLRIGLRCMRLWNLLGLTIRCMSSNLTISTSNLIFKPGKPKPKHVQ
jgi:hypothetical protein